MPDDAGPPDPMTELEVLAAHVAEQFRALVKAGVPPVLAAIMLGTMLGTAGMQGQQGDDGR